MMSKRMDFLAKMYAKEKRAKENKENDDRENLE